VKSSSLGSARYPGPNQDRRVLLSYGHASAPLSRPGTATILDALDSFGEPLGFGHAERLTYLQAKCQALE